MRRKPCIYLGKRQFTSRASCIDERLCEIHGKCSIKGLTEHRCINCDDYVTEDDDDPRLQGSTATPPQ